jgi:toxin-antitoxin system PIN domain toxin
VIAVDTNILVYAHREESRFHARASQKLRYLAEGAAAWAIPWPCVHEFLGVVTNPRIQAVPTPLVIAIRAFEDLISAASLSLLAEAPDYWPVLRSQLIAGQIAGARVHDARIAAICVQHGVSELWSADRDFTRFPRLKVVNPLIGP